MDKKDKVILMICLCTGAFMNLLDSTIVNVSIPHIAGTFGIAPFDGTWVITSYAVSEAILLPVIGWLTKRIGIIKQYLGSVLLFTFFSMLCGVSPTFELLLLFRVLQGVVGASMIPLSQALIVGLYPPEERSFPLGIWSMTVVFAPIIGPILGGYISDSFSWRWNFYINLPFGVISTFVAYSVYKRLGIDNKREKVPIDKVGVFLLVIGIGALQIMLDKGRQYDWFQNNYILALGIVAFIFLTILIIWEWYCPNPVVDIKLFKGRNFSVGSLCLFITIGTLYTMIIVIPLWLQEYLGYTAYESGLTLFLQALPILFLAPIVGKFANRLDLRKVIAASILIMAFVGIFITQYNVSAPQSFIANSRFFFGIGLALFFVPINVIALLEISKEEMPAASGIFNFMRNLGISFGTAISLNYWDRRISFHHNNLVGSINEANPNFQSYFEKLPGTVETKFAQLNEMIDLQSATLGVNDIMTNTALLLLCLIPIIFLIKNTKLMENIDLKRPSE